MPTSLHEAALASLRCAVLVHDDVIRYVNPQTCSLLRAESPSDLIGQPIECLVHPDAREAGRERREFLMETGNGFTGLHVKLRALDGTDVRITVDAVRITLETGPAICLVHRPDA